MLSTAKKSVHMDPSFQSVEWRIGKNTFDRYCFWYLNLFRLV
jgi:hypothetical protein